MEHELSAYYDVTHGEGLAVLTPAWMSYVLGEQTVSRFAMYARNVWDIYEKDKYRAAYMGITRTREFFSACGLPDTLAKLGIGRERFEEMAAEAVRTSGIATRSYVHLQKEDIVKIFDSCAV